MDDVYEKRKEIFFTNLLLLGFDVPYAEKKYGFTLTKDTFNVPNQKAFEVVTHFLFTKLNEVTRDEYRILWPVVDKPQEREFMKTCKAYLTKISKETTDYVRFPHVGQILMTPGGFKFYELYMAFSSYVMQRVVLKDKVCSLLYRPTITLENRRDIREVLHLSTRISTKRVAETQKASSDCQEIWNETAQNFISYYRKAKRQIAEKQMLFKELLHSFSDTGTEVSEEECFQKACVRSTELLQEVLCDWKALEENLVKEESLWDIIRCALQTECPEKPILDGQKYISQIPDFLKMNYKKELLEQGVQSLTEDNKLSIKRFLGVHLINLKHYERLLKEVGAPDLEGYSEELQNCINKLKSISEHARSLSKSLEQDMLPDISKEKKELEQKAYAEVSEEEIESIIRKLPPSLPSLSVADALPCEGEPEYYLQLSPKSECDFLSAYGCDANPPPAKMHFSEPLVSSDSIKRDMSERLSKLKVSSVKESGRKIQTSFPWSKPKASSCQPSQSHPQTVYDHQAVNHISDQNNRSEEDVLVNFSLNESQSDSFLHETPLFSSQYRTFSAANSFEISLDEKSNVNNVQKKFIEHLVSKYGKGSIGATSSSEEASPFSCSRDSDFMGERAFDKRDEVFRTPPSTEDVAVVQPFTKETSGGDEYFNSVDRGSYGRVTDPEDDELLDDITLPDVPILL